MPVPVLRLAVDLARSAVRGYRDDARGQIAILFGLSLTAIVVAVGGGIDLARAYQARQKLSSIAALTCQYAIRSTVKDKLAPSYAGANGIQQYDAAVQAYIDGAFVTQQMPASYTRTQTTFTHSTSGPEDLTLAVAVPTTFMQIARVTQIPVGATAHCFTDPNQGSTAPGNLVGESFEKIECSGYCYSSYKPDGTLGTPANPSGTFPAQPGYIGKTGNAWFITGYCLEVDAQGVINSTLPDGNNGAELDCDNGKSNRGNSAISTKVSMPRGYYELRYFYRSRVLYQEYDPAYICGTTDDDITWANSSNSYAVGPVAKTNQINVYLDQNVGGAPGFHTTIDGTQQLAGKNLIDECIYSFNWIERSVRLYVDTPGDYWLTFAADGGSDSFGGQLDNIRLCPFTCAGTVQENFPAAWTSPKGSPLLFEDSFETMSFSSTGDCGSTCASNGDLTKSYGTSGTSASGWPKEAQIGWMVAPYNQVNLFSNSIAKDGSQFIGLDGKQLSGGSENTSNRYAARRFLLVPGYYALSYYYTSQNPGGSSVSCGPTPSAAGYNTPLTGALGMFVGYEQAISVPISYALNSASVYLNPGAQTTFVPTPTVPLNAINLANYDATQPNTLVDTCGYANGWQTRVANFKIQRPGYYWLAAAALGTPDGISPVIDDVKLTALGGTAMSPPASFVTVNVPPTRQPGSSVGYPPYSSISYSGFRVVVDPFALPAPMQ